MSMTAGHGLQAQLGSQMRGPSAVVWLSAAAVGLLILWAAFAWVDEIVRAEGSMISSSRPQIIQNLEGGILAELAVAEGDIVEAGEMLAKLQGTQFRSAVDDLGAQIAGLEVRRLRLEAELAEEFDFSVPEALRLAAPKIYASERALLAARQTDFLSRREGAARILDEAAQEKELLEDLFDRNIVALIEVTRVRKTYADARTKLDEIITRTSLERAEAYADTLREINTLGQTLKASQDQLDRTVLRAPMRGVVNNLSVTTIGGVVRPGQEILQIIPLDEELFVEAQVAPEDIAGVRPGQRATIKLSAYDYTIFGTHSGRVKLVSADVFKDKQRPDDAAHYKVLVSVDMNALSPRQQSFEIRPGMQAAVELHTGSKTVLHYLLRPLYKSREAFREP